MVEQLIPLKMARELAHELTLNQAVIIAEELATRLEKHFTVEPTLTLTEAAEQIGVSITVMRQLCREKKIRAIRLDKSYRIRVVDINRFLDERTQEVAG